MKKAQPSLLRPAIAMIELIFAITIMGIVLMSAPMMINSATKSSTVAFQQESIAIAAAHTAALMTYAWDEQNTDGRQDNDKELCTPSLTFRCNNSTNTVRFRKVANNPAYGINASPSDSFGTPDPDIIDASIAEADPDDIDDFDGNTTQLTIITSDTQADEGDYIDQTVSLSTKVLYALDSPSGSALSTCSSGNGCAYSKPTPSGGTVTNVKLIRTTLTSTNPVLGDKNIVLKAFMCNIGNPDVASREGY